MATFWLQPFGRVQVGRCKQLQKLSKCGRNGSMAATCAGPRCPGDGGGWARNWDAFPAEGICRENREL